MTETLEHSAAQNHSASASHAKDVDVAVLILNCNGVHLIQQFLPSVIKNTPKNIAKIIVVDNGSTDESIKILQQEFPEIETITLDKNYGFAGAYNKAIAMTGYKYSVLLNSDVETPDGWLTPLYEYMESHPDVGACQPKVLSYNEKDKFEYAGACGGMIDCNGYPFCRGRIFSHCEVDLGQYDTVMQVFWATGAALMVRSDLYIEIGGLDNDFFAHMEEIDLCWRIQLKNRKIVVVPQSRVYHLGGGSLPASNPQKTYLNFRNNLLLLHKNLPGHNRGKILFRRRILDTIAWLKFILSLDFANANAVIKAHRHFSKMRKKYTQHPDKSLIPYSPNIILEYYIKGHKKYSDIL